MATKTKPVVTNDTGERVEVLASEIRKVATAARVLMSTSLSDKTILLLLSHSSGVSQVNCKKVLTAAENLAFTYLKK
jgi:hypothetical protein